MRGILLNNIFGLIFIFLSFLSRCSKNKCNTTTIEETFCLLVRHNTDNIEDLLKSGFGIDLNFKMNKIEANNQLS